METYRKKRGENWSLEEKELLCKLVESSANIIEDKCTKTTINLKKANEWRNIMKKFNRLTGKSRSIAEMKLAWKRMKLSAKSNLPNFKSTLKTAQNSSKPPSTPVDLPKSPIITVSPLDILIECDDCSSDEVMPESVSATCAKDPFEDFNSCHGSEDKSLLEDEKYSVQKQIIREVKKKLNTSRQNTRSEFNKINSSLCNINAALPTVTSNSDLKKRQLDMMELEHKYNIKISELKIKKLMLEISILENKKNTKTESEE